MIEVRIDVWIKYLGRDKMESYGVLIIFNLSGMFGL